MELFIFLLPVLFLIFIIIGDIRRDNSGLLQLGTMGLFIFSILAFITLCRYKNKPIIIEKSSNSDWVYSNNKEIKRDTIITQIKVINGDTIYPTTEYKVIKRK